MSKTNILELAAVLMIVVGISVFITGGVPYGVTIRDCTFEEIDPDPIDVNSDGITIIAYPCRIEFDANGAVVPVRESTGDPNDGVLPRLLPKLLPKVRNFIP